MNLVIDVGNTRSKLAVFDEKKLIDKIIISKNELFQSLKELFLRGTIKNSIISEVSDVSEEIINFLKNSSNLHMLSADSKIPFKNLYKTKETLGLDRIALIAGAVSHYPNKNVLVIDAGTCITYDFINAKQEYLGGAISPGLTMRYKALKEYTSKLPYLEFKKPNYFIGNSSKESIHSGVVGGLIQEIEGMIGQYKHKFLLLTVVLTGGDTNFLSKQLKSSIFANQNFLLEGLNEVLIYNNNK